MSRIVNRFAGIIPAVLGISVLFIPIATLEITILNSVVPAESYNLIELLDVLQGLERNFFYVKVSSALLVVGSLLNLSTIVDRRRIAYAGILAQFASLIIFYTQFLGSGDEISLVSVSPDIGFYAIVIAPIVGLIIMMYPSDTDESDNKKRMEKDVYEDVRKNE